MFKTLAAFSGFSVDDLAAAKKFYVGTLGLKLNNEEMGLDFSLPGGGKMFVYPKDDHKPATFTILNFVVDHIDTAVDALKDKGVEFEHYDLGGGAKTDAKGIMRGLAAKQGPDIAWFKDPAGNIIAVLQDGK